MNTTPLPPPFDSSASEPKHRWAVQPVASLANLAALLVLASVAFTLVGLVVGMLARPASAELIDRVAANGEWRSAYSRVTTYYVMSGAVGSIGGLVRLGAAVTSVVWMFRVVGNNHRLFNEPQMGPNWAIFGWLVLPGVPIAPYLLFRQMWSVNQSNRVITALARFVRDLASLHTEHVNRYLAS